MHVETLRKGIQFDNLLDPNGETISDNTPLFIPWEANYFEVEKIANKIDKYEFGIDYDFGIRTIFGSIAFYWLSRGGLEKSEKFRGITATVGFNETGHQGLLNTRQKLIAALGQPASERNNFEDYKKAIETYEPWNCWEFNTIRVILWGSEFRGSFWYKLDIQKHP